MPSIGIIKRSLSPFGGLEKYTKKIADYFLQKKIDVTFLTLGHQPQTASHYQYINITRKGFLPHQKLLSFEKGVKAALKQHSFDITLAMDRYSAPTHIRAGNGCHKAFLKRRKKIDSFIKTTLSLYNPVHRVLLDIEKKSVENAFTKKIIVNSHMVEREFLEYYNVPKDKIVVVHNGVEWNEITPLFEQRLLIKEALIKELGLSPFSFYFLFIGNDYERKGLGIVMDALSKIPSDWHLLVIGKDKKIEKFKKKAISLKIENKISFFGYRKDVTRFYALADCALIPSVYDPFANVTLEALAHGCFVISSKSNGGHEIINNGAGHIIEDLFDKESVLSSLKRGLEYQKNEANAFATRMSISHLDFDVQLKQLLDICLET
ncbi:MAG: glycosyltransferase family 4 protein [Chlamydiales bacterium]|nr:glycosyltransferase family 4 protein [Chlamydiales bacterium]